MEINLHETPYVPVYKRVSYFYIPALFVVTTVLLDVMMYINMHWPFPPAYIFSLSIVLLIAALVSLCRYKWLQTVICSLLLGLQLTTTISNIIAQDTCMEIFSLETLKTMATAFNNTESIILDLWFLTPIILLIVVYIVAVVLIMWFCRMPRNYRPTNKHTFLCGALAFVSFFSYTVAYSASPNYKKGIENYVANLGNQKFLYDTFSNRVLSLRTFGSYSFYLDNLLYLWGGKTATTDVLDLTVDDFNANEFALNENEVLGDGYNLIMVLMETFEREAINPITMPNLTKFMAESCVDVNGYYSMERTCFTDYIGQTGMHTLGQEWWSNYGDVAVPHSLANIFNRSGYVTAAFHDSDGKTYKRNELFEPSLGFQSFNNFTTYDNPQYTQHFGLNADELLFKENLEKIAPSDQNFYSYVISVSTHAINPKYDFNDYPDYQPAVKHIKEHWDELTAMYPSLLSDNADKVQIALNYLTGTYSFDQGFGALIDYLKGTDDELHPGKKLIETTALVMFGDHYYYANPAVLIETETPSLMGNRCPFIVYNPRQVLDKETGMTQGDNAVLPEKERQQCGTVMDRFTSTMDIYPTVCSLFGIVTDQQLTYGHSIFDESPSLGVGYMNGYTWGVNGYDADNDRWHIWCTIDFKDFLGEKISAAQAPAMTTLINRTYASIHANMVLLEQNGFKDLEKAKAYCLRPKDPK